MSVEQQGGRGILLRYTQEDEKIFARTLKDALLIIVNTFKHPQKEEAVNPRLDRFFLMHYVRTHQIIEALIQHDIISLEDILYLTGNLLQKDLTAPSQPQELRDECLLFKEYLSTMYNSYWSLAKRPNNGHAGAGQPYTQDIV